MFQRIQTGQVLAEIDFIISQASDGILIASPTPSPRPSPSPNPESKGSVVIDNDKVSKSGARTSPKPSLNPK